MTQARSQVEEQRTPERANQTWSLSRGDFDLEADDIHVDPEAASIFTSACAAKIESFGTMPTKYEELANSVDTCDLDNASVENPIRACAASIEAGINDFAEIWSMQTQEDRMIAACASPEALVQSMDEQFNAQLFNRVVQLQRIVQRCRSSAAIMCKFWRGFL